MTNLQIKLQVILYNLQASDYKQAWTLTFSKLKLLAIKFVHASKFC